MGKDIFNHRRELERKTEKSKSEEKKIAKELEKLKDECNHEIIVKTLETAITKNWYGRLRLNIYPPETMCLICGKKFDTTRVLSPKDIEKLSKSVVIDMKRYSELSKEDNASFINKAENYYKLVKSEMPDATEYEIGKGILEEMEILNDFLKDE